METVELLSRCPFRAKRIRLAEAAAMFASSEDDPRRCGATQCGKNPFFYLRQSFSILGKLRNHWARVNPTGTLSFPILRPRSGWGRCSRVPWGVHGSGSWGCFLQTLQNQPAVGGGRTKDKETHPWAACKSDYGSQKQGRDAQSAKKPNRRDPDGSIEAAGARPISLNSSTAKTRQLRLNYCREFLRRPRHDACRLERQVFAETRNHFDNMAGPRPKIDHFIAGRPRAGNHKCCPKNRPGTPGNRRSLSAANSSRAGSVSAWFRDYLRRDSLRRGDFLSFDGKYADGATLAERHISTNARDCRRKGQPDHFLPRATRWRQIAFLPVDSLFLGGTKSSFSPRRKFAH